MAARESSAAERALALYLEGKSLTEAASTAGVSPSTLTRALVRHGIPRRGPPRGEQHHAWIDGRKAVKRSAAQG